MISVSESLLLKCPPCVNVRLSLTATQMTCVFRSVLLQPSCGLFTYAIGLGARWIVVQKKRVWLNACTLPFGFAPISGHTSNALRMHMLWVWIWCACLKAVRWFSWDNLGSHYGDFPELADLKLGTGRAQ